MTTPGGWTPPSGTNHIVPAGVAGGLAGHAATTEEDWREYLEGSARPHWEGAGGPIEVLREFVGAIVEAFRGDSGPLGALVEGVQSLVIAPLAHLLAWIVGGDPEDWDTLEEIRDNLIPALIRLPLRILVQLIGGIPVVGGAFEAALANWLRQTNETATEAAETVVTVGTQVNYVQQIIAVQSGMGAWETGPDRTGTPSFPFAFLYLHSHTVPASGLSASTGTAGSHSHTVSGTTGSTNGHNHSFSDTVSVTGHTHSVSLSGSATAAMDVPTVACTASYAPWANVIFKSAGERKVVSWLAYRTGTVSTFSYDVYRLEADGSSTLVYSSPNLAGEVPTVLGWMMYLIDSQTVIADIGDSYDVQFRMTGSGTVYLAGINFPYPTPLPGFRPYAPGSARNPSSNPAPATIPTATRDGMYTGPTPFVSIGIDVGQTQLPRFFFDDFNRGDLGSLWVAYGSIGISSNRVGYKGAPLFDTTAAMVYHQPLASDVVEASADMWLDEAHIGIGIGCTSNLASGVWLAATDDTISISTGSYSSRTNRTPVISPPGDGRYTLRRIRSGDDTHYIYQAFFGDPDTSEPILTWADTGNLIPVGWGRRWVGVLARRNGLLYPSGRADNWVARDLTSDDEEE